MENQLQMAFEFAADLAKQLITISTAVLTFSLTFVKDIVKNQVRTGANRLKWLKIAWIFLFISIIGGVWSLSALTGSLAPLNGSDTPELGSNTRLPAAVQVVSFLIGLIFLISYAWSAFISLNSKKPPMS